MALPSEVVNYPFAGGLDQKTDPWLIEAPRLSALTNGVFTKNGQIRKRLGLKGASKSIQGGGSLSSAARLAFRKTEQVLIDGHSLYSYSPSLAAQSLAPHVKTDQVPELTAVRSAVDNGPVTAWDADCGYVPISAGVGFEVYSWTNGAIGGVGGDVFVTVIDTATGTTVFRSYKLTTGATFQQTFVCVVGTTAIVVYLDASVNPGFLKCRRLDLTNPTAWTTEQTLRSDIQFSTFMCAFDAIGQDDRFLVAYQSSIAAPKLMVATFTSAGVAITNAVVTGEVFAGQFTTISVGHATVHTDHTLIVYSGNFGTKNAWVNSVTLATTGAPVSISNTLAATAAGSVKIDANTSALVMNMVVIGGSSATECWSYKIAVDSAALATYHATWGFAVSSKPFLSNGRAYVLGSFAVGSQSATTFIVDLQIDQNNVPPNHRPVTTIAPRFSATSAATGRAIANGGLARTATVDANTFLTIGTILRSNTYNALMGMTRVLISNANANRFQPLEIGEDLQLTGGVPSYYDGRTVGEIGFLSYPDSNTMIFTPATTGGNMSAGAYVYSLTYELTDAAGQRHRSATSVQKLVTVGGTTTSKVTITQIPFLSLTARQDNDNSGTPQVEIVIYRSTVGGTTLYRLTPEQTPTALLNDMTNQYASFTDTYFDNNAPNGQLLNTNPLIYTTGGVLDNVCPPCATLGVVHRGRVWLAGTDDPRVVWFSKQFVTGEAVAFSDQFTFVLEDRNPITALGSLDDKLIIFTRSSIYVVTGDGPTDSGVGNDLSTPQRIASDVGCIEPRSVVLTPDGLMFQSEEGIMLLSRALQVSYIGHPVEDTLAANPIITSAIVKGDQNQVIFTTQQVGSVFGFPIRYDYIQRAWSTDDPWDIDLGTDGVSFQSAIRSPGGVYTCVTPGGQVYTERNASDAAAYLDGVQGNLHWVTLTIGTAWIKLSGIQGYQRVRKFGLLMDQKTPHGLLLNAFTDYSTVPNVVTQAEVLTDAQLAAMTIPPEQPMFRVGCQNGMSPKCQALRLYISDTQPTTHAIGTGQGPTFTGVSFEIARKYGLNRVGAVAKW